MKLLFLLLGVTFLYAVPIPVRSEGIIKVACIGASITQGVTLSHPESQAYPQQLQKLLGSSYEVTNYGASGTTLLRKGELSYWNSPAYQAALRSHPDIVTIDLGGNDAKLVNRVHMEDFLQDARDLVHSFYSQGHHPRIIILLPFPSFVRDSAGIYDPVIVRDIIPRLRRLARSAHLEVVDMHTPFEDKESWMPDKIHPNEEGAALTARILYRQINDRHVSRWPDDYSVTWDQPGPGSSQSMPLGNGDIGLNVWVDPGGDLLFYISKTDAWGGEKDPDADPWMQQGGTLMKLGLVRISCGSGPLLRGASFRQTLLPGEGEIRITEGEGNSTITYRIWVDANHPVIRVEVTGRRPAETRVYLSDWRLRRGDSLLAARDHITWCHRNPSSGDPRLADPHLADISFGAAIEGSGLVRKDDSTLVSLAPVVSRLITIVPLTATTPTLAEYRALLDRQVRQIDRLDINLTRSAHRQWWRQFWQRSRICVSGNATADSVTRGYVLQRFVTAIAGRGAYPIKFNGSIFVVDDPAWKVNGRPAPMNADFRAWGGQYWFQNTRPLYWPCLMAGDFDMMLPLFRMYTAMLPGNSELVHQYYGHGGTYFQETSPFWGGLPFMGPGEEALYTHHYFTPVLELSMMLLDYYEYTGDERFARQYLLPIASAGLEFFARHFPRDSAGRLLLDPDNSIEMFWKVHDPAPDIAGLKAVLIRMLALPEGLAADSLRKQWSQTLNILPPLPIDTSDGQGRLLPYTGPQTARVHNEENPELYSIYPFRLFGPGKPGLELARHSFEIRKCPQKGCWSQDPIQAAMLGFTDIAKEDVRYALTRKDPALKFPAFWDAGHDYKPDEDNGGNGENGLQQMLLQTDGRKIFLLPAWPADWDADFKLHAPYRTIIEGQVREGRLTRLVVTPAYRRADIIDWPQARLHKINKPAI